MSQAPNTRSPEPDSYSLHNPYLVLEAVPPTPTREAALFSLEVLAHSVRLRGSQAEYHSAVVEAYILSGGSPDELKDALGL